MLERLSRGEEQDKKVEGDAEEGRSEGGGWERIMKKIGGEEKKYNERK